MMVDHYQRLGISRNASSIEIKKAYKKLALQYHPDKNKASDAHEIFKSIVESYTILSDPQRKSQYDKTQLFSGSGASSFTSTRPRPAANSFFNGFAYNASNFDAHKRKFHQQQNSSSSTFYQHFQNAFKSAYNEYDDLDNQFFQSFSHQNTRFGNPNVSSYSSQSVPKTSRYQQGAYANNYKKGEPYFSHKSKTTADSGTGTNSASHAPKFGKVFEKTDRPDIRSTKNDENWTRSKTGYSYVAAGKEAKFLRTENTTTDPSNIKHAAGPTRNAKSTTETAKNNSPYFASTETPKKTPPTSHNHSKVNDPNIPNIFASPELDSTEQPSSSQPSGLRGSVFNTHPVGGTKTDPIVIEEEKSKKEKTPSPLEKNFFSKDNLTYTSPFQYKREAVKKEKGISSDEEKEADSHHEDHLEKENQADDSAKYDMLDALLRESANDLKRPSGSGNKRYRNSRSTTPLMKKNVFQTRFTYQNKKPTFAKGVSGRPSRTDLEIGIEDGDHDTVTPNLFESEEEESEDIEEININEDIKRNVFDVSDSDTDLSDSVNEKLEKSSEDENNPGMDSIDGIDKQPKSQTREESIIDIDPDVEVLETEEVFFADELDKQQKESSKDNKFTLHGIDSIPPFTQDKESNFDLNGMLSSLDPAATRENGKTNDKEKHFGQKKFEYIDSGATRKNVENIHLPVNNVYVQTKSSKLGLEDLFASEKILHVHPPSPPPFLKDLSKEGWIAYHEKVKRYQSEWLRYCDYINKYNQDRISSMAQRLDDMLGSVQNSEIYLQALQRDINVQEEWVFSRKQNIEVLKHYYDNVRIMRANGFDF